MTDVPTRPVTSERSTRIQRTLTVAGDVGVVYYTRAVNLCFIANRTPQLPRSDPQCVREGYSTASPGGPWPTLSVTRRRFRFGLAHIQRKWGSRHDQRAYVRYIKIPNAIEYSRSVAAAAG